MLKYNKSSFLSSTTVQPEPDPAIVDKRASFAAGMAEATFGRNCPHPDSHSFVDRTPEQVCAARESSLGRGGER